MDQQDKEDLQRLIQLSASPYMREIWPTEAIRLAQKHGIHLVHLTTIYHTNGHKDLAFKCICGWVSSGFGPYCTPAARTNRPINELIAEDERDRHLDLNPEYEID